MKYDGSQSERKTMGLPGAVGPFYLNQALSMEGGEEAEEVCSVWKARGHFGKINIAGAARARTCASHAYQPISIFSAHC